MDTRKCQESPSLPVTQVILFFRWFSRRGDDHLYERVICNQLQNRVGVFARMADRMPILCKTMPNQDTQPTTPPSS